uniref:Heparan-sulfate 6-O-sulfotransferase n=1 Tax=Steinernema glaseri TaxID=37863 RepID=A0A1I7ZA80_9BILA
MRRIRNDPDVRLSTVMRLSKMDVLGIVLCALLLDQVAGQHLLDHARIIAPPSCSDAQMTELHDNFFLTLTNRGFIPVKIGGHSLKQMNDWVDHVLEEEHQRHPRGTSEHTLIRLFYVNETTMAFLRYPDLARRNEDGFDRAVSYWITHTRGSDFGRFIPFPPENRWTKIGSAYDEKEWICQSFGESPRRICNPENLIYSLENGWFTFSQHEQSSRLSTSMVSSRDNQFAVTQKRCETPGCVFVSGARDGQWLHPYRYVTQLNIHGKPSDFSEDSFKEQYNSVLDRKDRKEVHLQKDLQTEKLCLLRRYKQELDEVPETFLLSSVAKTLIIAYGKGTQFGEDYINAGGSTFLSPVFVAFLLCIR